MQYLNDKNPDLDSEGEPERILYEVGSTSKRVRSRAGVKCYSSQRVGNVNWSSGFERHKFLCCFKIRQKERGEKGEERDTQVTMYQSRNIWILVGSCMRVQL
jgi:hypothetical protein